MFKMGLAFVHRGSGVNRDVPLYVRERTTTQKCRRLRPPGEEGRSNGIVMDGTRRGTIEKGNGEFVNGC